MTSHRDLTTALDSAGELPGDWATAFAAVDRALFVPSRVWFDDEHGQPQPLNRDTDPQRWREAVYSDNPVVTQLDDGATVWPDTSRMVTSSASQPSMVLVMLDALDLHESMRVLEIGTGTGYNAALLAERVGSENVATIELDPGLAEQAAARLAAVGYKPTVICGDGTVGHSAGAPYDRVIATAAAIAGQVPYAWVAQTRPGGRIVTPWGTAYHNGALVRLTVSSDGTASGPVVGNAAFMRLRDQRTPFGHVARLGDIVDTSTTAVETTSTVPPGEVAIDADGAFSVGLHLAGVQRSVAYDDAHTYEVLLYHVASESVATVQVNPDTTADGRYPVRQHGPRRLWDEAEIAHASWVAHGRPARTRHGLTVHAHRQEAWLDDRANTVTTTGAP